MAPNLPKPPTPPLDIAEQVRILRSEIRDLVKAYAARVAAMSPGVPAVQIEHQLMNKAGWCECAAHELLQKEPA